MTTITLYHAEWCGYCKTFVPEWDKMVNDFKKLGIEYHKYEESLNPAEFEAANIQSYPTIKITKDNLEYTYVGPRTKEAILTELKKKVHKPTMKAVEEQSGGSLKYREGVDYHKKYLKYKAKYLKLLNN